MLRHRAPKAYSLLEVVLASGICATALVPALALLRDGMSLAEKIDTRHLLLLYGVSKMEEQLADVAANWSTGPVPPGNFAPEHANIRFTVTRAVDPASDRLMVITTTTYSDDNGNGLPDADEMRTTLTTKVANLNSYPAGS